MPHLPYSLAWTLALKTPQSLTHSAPLSPTQSQAVLFLVFSLRNAWGLTCVTVYEPQGLGELSSAAFLISDEQSGVRRSQSELKWGLEFGSARLYLEAFWERKMVWLLFAYCSRPSTEKAMAPHSSTLAWKIPWMEEPGGLQSMRSLRVGHNWATSLSLFTSMRWRRKWQPTPVFLPGESQGRGSLVGCRLWGRAESDTTERLSSSSKAQYSAWHTVCVIDFQKSSLSNAIFLLLSSFLYFSLGFLK